VLVPPPDYVLVPLTGAIILMAAVLIAALFSARLKRAAAAQACEILDKSAKLAEQISELSSVLAATDARLAMLAGRLDEQSRSTQGTAPTSYNVAIRMARSGASRQELMSTCGVTQQEADLVLRLHASDPNVRSAA
jgi:endonuclease III